MKTIRTMVAILAASSLVPAAASAQATFEGKVSYSMQMGEMAMELTTYAKGDHVRQEISGSPIGQVISLVDAKKQEVTMIMPAQQAYMTMDMGTVMSMAGQQQNDENVDVKRTGEKETVAGHTCENVLVSSKQGEIRICVASDLGFFFMGTSSGGGRMGGPTPGLNPELEKKFRDLFKDGFFPLKVTTNADGQSVTMTATSVERTSVSDDMFVVPAGYTKMGGMGGR